MTRSVVVVGGGLAGLAAAWELTGGPSGPGPDAPRVEVIEAAGRVGGPLLAGTFGGRTVDLGPDGYLARRPEATQLITELGRADDLVPIAASGASLYVGARLVPIPRSLSLGVPTTVDAVREAGLSWRARWAARRDLWWPAPLEVGEDASIGRIVRTKLGDEIAATIVEPMIGGIQAGRIDDLSAATVFPPLLAAARRGGSLMKALTPPAPTDAAPTPTGPAFYSLRDGLGSLPPTLRRALEERGVLVRTGVAVSAVRRAATGPRWLVETDATVTPADAVILATPAVATAQLVGGLDDDLAALARVDRAGAAMVALLFGADDLRLPPAGTGVLVPLGTPWRDGGTMMTTALTFLDRKWPHLAREGETLLRVHVGRIDDRRWSEMDDDALVARVVEELGLLVGAGAPREVAVSRWTEGLAQYRVGHAALVERARAAAARVGLHLAGSSYDGVGVPASIASGRAVAREVLAGRD